MTIRIKAKKTLNFKLIIFPKKIGSFESSKPPNHILKKISHNKTFNIKRKFPFIHFSQKTFILHPFFYFFYKIFSMGIKGDLSKMTEENTNFIGNLSTILKTLCMMIAGYAIGYAVSIGLDLPIDATQLSEILFTILCTIGAYIDAKNPNSFKWLHNDTTAPTEQQLVLKEIVLNEEYTTTDEEENGGDDGC